MRASSYVVGTPRLVAHRETIIQSSLFPGWRFHLWSSAQVAFLPVSFSTVCSADFQNVSRTSINTPSTSNTRISGSIFRTARFATSRFLSDSSLVYPLPCKPRCPGWAQCLSPLLMQSSDSLRLPPTPLPLTFRLRDGVPEGQSLGPLLSSKGAP